MSTMFDPLNIILLAVAALVLWKLKSVLGERTGLERRPTEVATPRTERDNVVRLPGTETKPELPKPAADPVWKGYAEPDSALALGLEAVAGASRDFAVQPFIDGAKAAYEMVLEGFAKGDKVALKALLSKDVYDGFAAAIDERQRTGQVMTLQFVGIKSAKLEEARLEGRKAQVSIRFVGEMISALTAMDGAVIDGDPRQVRDVVDHWTFEREVSSRDPNWKLIDTSGDT
jgi:predicted lipid-binding transport protein (Tim44 family)